MTGLTGQSVGIRSGEPFGVWEAGDVGKLGVGNDFTLPTSDAFLLRWERGER